MRPLLKPAPPRPPRLVTRGGITRDPLEVVRCALQDTIGSYCSLCEMPVYVEEGVMSRRSRMLTGVPSLDEWGSLLLACDWCRHFRRHDVAALDDYVWPDDVDATFAVGGGGAFTYALREVESIGGDGEARQSLSLVTASDRRAQNTIELFQLNALFHDWSANGVAAGAAGAAVDQRVRLRTNAWQFAQKSATALEEARANPEPYAYAGMAPLIASLAQATGFWSVWMTVLWERLHDQQVLRDVLLETDDRDGYMITGYQTFPDGGVPPWKIFAGTAIDRVLF